MNIERFRSSFTVYFIDANSDRAQKLLAVLRGAGYSCFYFESSHEAARAALENPPHSVIMTTDEVVEAQYLTETMVSVVPEAHIFVLTSIEQREYHIELLSAGAFEVLSYPLANDQELIYAADRAAERDYYMYMNEQLKEKVDEMSQQDSHTSYSLFGIWQEQMAAKASVEEAVKHFMTEVRRCRPEHKVIFFKFLPAHRSLMATQADGISADELRGLGISLNEDSGTTPVELLRHPSHIPSLKDLIHGLLDSPEFTAAPLEVLGEVKGVFAFCGPQPLASSGYIRCCQKVLAQTCERLVLERRLHTASVNDDETHVMNRQNFLIALNNELSRARRTSLPVSLLILSVDDFEQVQTQRGDEEARLVLRTVAGMIRKNSRINDIVGRLATDEFGLILPHTGEEGAAIKAERLRRMMESADFSRFLSADTRITLSIGVAEYPGHCHDADEIVQVADEALYAVKKAGKNKVCLASVPEGFVPDFMIRA